MNCEYCGGSLNYLGKLGSAEYARCENCGMDWMLHASDLELVDRVEASEMLDRVARR